MADPKRLRFPTTWFEGGCSIHLNDGVWLKSMTYDFLVVRCYQVLMDLPWALVCYSVVPGKDLLPMSVR